MTVRCCRYVVLYVCWLMRAQIGFVLFVAYSGQPQLITGEVQLNNAKNFPI